MLIAIMLYAAVGCVETMRPKAQPPLPPAALATMPSTSLAAGLPDPVPHTISWTMAPATNSPFVLLQGSQDLSAWTDLGRFDDANGDYTFTDTNGLPKRFYRVMAVGSEQVVTNLGVQ